MHTVFQMQSYNKVRDAICVRERLHAFATEVRFERSDIM